MYSNETTLLYSLLGQKIMVIGHRGVGTTSLERGNLPENTLAGFQMAFLDGADMVELDITLTWDNRIIVFHDDQLERTTDGLGSIQNYRLESLRKLDAGKGTIWEGKNIYLNTLREIFHFLLKNDLNHSINIEIKTYHGSRRAFQLYRETIITKLMQLINEFDVFKRVIISSFDIRILVFLRRKHPTIITALLAAGEKWTIKKMIKNAIRFGINGIHPQFSIIKSKTEIDEAKKNNLFIQPYVLNTTKEFQKAIKFGVTGIITDFPEKLRDFLDNE